MPIATARSPSLSSRKFDGGAPRSNIARKPSRLTAIHAIAVTRIAPAAITPAQPTMLDCVSCSTSSAPFSPMRPGIAEAIDPMTASRSPTLPPSTAMKTANATNSAAKSERNACRVMPCASTGPRCSR